MPPSGRYDPHINAFMQNPSQVYEVPQADTAPNPQYFRQALLNRISYRGLREHIAASLKDGRVYMGRTHDDIREFLGVKPRRKRKQQDTLFFDCLHRFLKSRKPFAVVRYTNNSPCNVRNGLTFTARKHNLPVVACVNFYSGQLYVIRTDIKEGKHDIQLF